jgi:hypothetical protein
MNMAINNPGNINPLIGQNVVDMSPGKNNMVKKMEGAQGGVIVDKIDISRKAKELSKALNAVNQLPEIRYDAVEKAKQRVAEDKSRTPASQIAAKMLLEE